MVVVAQELVRVHGRAVGLKTDVPVVRLHSQPQKDSGSF